MKLNWLVFIACCLLCCRCAGTPIRVIRVEYIPAVEPTPEMQQDLEWMRLSRGRQRFIRPPWYDGDNPPCDGCI